MRGRSDQSRAQYDGAQPSSVLAGEQEPSVSTQPIDIISPELGGMASFNTQRRDTRRVSKPGNGGDALVFIAMGLVSAALGLGLYAHVGIDLPVALIAALGLFVSTSFLHVFVRRMQGVDLLDRRVTALEDKVSQFDEGTQISAAEVPQVGSIADPIAPLTLPQSAEIPHAPEVALAPSPVAEERAPSWPAQPSLEEPVDLSPAYQIPRDATAGFAPESLAPAQGSRAVEAPELAVAHSENAGAVSMARDDSVVDLAGQPTATLAARRSEDQAASIQGTPDRSIDGLVRQLAQGMGGSEEGTESQARSDLAGEPVEVPVAAGHEPAVPTFGQRIAPPASRREAGETPLIAMPAKPTTEAMEFGATAAPIVATLDMPPEPISDPIGLAIHDAVEQSGVEIYLQPILSIEDRKIRFFEVLGRIKGVGGEVIATEEHVDLARSMRLSGKLDQAIMARTARLLRKLSERRQAQPLFCNVSRETLSNNAFAHEFIEFMRRCRDIAPFLIFEVDHAAVSGSDATTLANLRTLTSMGFRLSFDNVSNVEQALANGRELEASFIKLGYDVLFSPQQSQADARARAATIQNVARDSGMTLVVDRIERKDQLAGVVSVGANLGQGYLFSEPKPLLPQVAAEVADEAAVA